MENTLLSDIFTYNDVMADCIGLITKDDLSPRGGMIYEAMEALYKDNSAIDVSTVANRLGSKLQDVGGITALAEISAASPNHRGYKDHIKAVKKDADLKRIFLSCQTAIEESKEGGDPVEIIGRLESSLLQTAEVEKDMDIAEVMQKTLEMVEQGFRNGGKIRGITTGFQALDNATGGFNRGDLMIVAARPSVGKTAFILNMMANIPKQYKAALFELEMSEDKIGARLLARMSGINPKDLSRGKIQEGDFDRVIKCVDHIASPKNLYFDCRAGLSVSQIRAKAKKMKLKHGLDVIFVDHIGIMRPDNPRASRNDQVGTISRELKAIAKDLDICVVALSQLNRAVEGRSDKRPALSDLRDSGNVEQDADQVLMLYRDDYYQDDNDPVSTLEIIVAKNRDGECGVFRVAYDTNTQRMDAEYGA